MSQKPKPNPKLHPKSLLEATIELRHSLPAASRFSASPLRRLRCFFGFHGEGSIPLGVTIHLVGRPLEKHQCLRCGRIFWD